MRAKWWMVAAAGVALAACGPMADLGGPWSPAIARAQEAQGAQAAEDDETLREMMILAIDRDSAGYYATLMGFDALQRELALDLHREYHGQYRDAAVAIRDLMEKSEEAMGDDFEKFEEVMRETMRAVLGFLDRVVVLGDQFVADLGDLATSDAQKAGHQRVVGARHREMAVALAGMDGGNEGIVDLIRVGRGIDPPLLPAEGDDPAAQALYEYEAEVNALSGPMIGKALEGIRSMVKLMSEGGEDEALQERLEADMSQMADRFNAANERAFRRVHTALPEARQAAWDQAYKRARWPEVYAPNEFHRTHEAALKAEGLSPDQREAIDAAQAQYAREAEPANQKWAAAMAEQRDFARKMSAQWDQSLWEQYQAKTQAVEDAGQARFTLDQRFIDRVLKVLTPAQREAMPKTGGGVDVDDVLRQMDGG